MRKAFRSGPLLTAGALIVPMVLAGAAGISSAAPAGVPVLVSIPPGSVHFKDGPPGRVTGGFGEDSCHACHFDGEENDGEGGLTLSGLPERFTPGATYTLELTLTRPGMEVAGFQLAVRHADGGEQAGVLAVPDGWEQKVGILEEQEVLFAHHLLGGIELVDRDTARWAILWTAPESGERLLVHAAALAGDGDDSQIGDHVHTLEAVTGLEGGARSRR